MDCEESAKLKRVGTLRGGWREDCKKKMRVAALRGSRWRMEQKSAKLRDWGIKGH